MKYLRLFESVDISMIEDNIYGILVSLEEKGFIYDIRDKRKNTLSVWIGIDVGDMSEEEIEYTDANYFEKDDLDDIKDIIDNLNSYMNYKLNAIVKYGYFDFHNVDKERDSFVYCSSIDDIFEIVWQISGIKIKYTWNEIY